MDEILETYQVTMNMVQTECKHIMRHTFLSSGKRMWRKEAQAGYVFLPLPEHLSSLTCGSSFTSSTVKGHYSYNAIFMIWKQKLEN